MIKETNLKEDSLPAGIIAITRMEYYGLKKTYALFERLSADLKEYMGLNNEFLASDKFLSRYNKKELLEKIHQQRCVIQKLVEELEPSKRDGYLSFLQKLYDEV